MKNNLLKSYLAAFCFCSASILFAQPGTNDTNNDLEGAGDTTPAAPIDDYVGILTLVGLTYVLIKVKANQKLENSIE